MILTKICSKFFVCLSGEIMGCWDPGLMLKPCFAALTLQRETAESISHFLKAEAAPKLDPALQTQLNSAL